MYKKLGNTTILDDDLLRVEKLEEGIYTMVSMKTPDDRLVLGVTKYSGVEQLVRFDHEGINFTIGRVKEFVAAKDKFKSMDICHKLGLLWHGPAGTGKTSAARLLMQDLSTEFGAICIDATGYNAGAIAKMSKHIRGSQDNLIVMFYDEFDAVSEDHDLLTYLDGCNSVQGTVFIGCTNHLDRIPDRIKARPSRIRYVVPVDKMPMEMYRSFISAKVPDWSGDKVSKLAYMCSEQGMVIDQVKNAVIDVEVYGTSIEEVTGFKIPEGDDSVTKGDGEGFGLRLWGGPSDPFKAN